MHDLITIMGWNLVVITTMMLIGWAISLYHENVTVVDSLWGIGFVLVAWNTFLISEGYLGRKLLIATAVTLWGLRLSLYLTWRNWRKGEDPRYGAWRQKSGDRFWIVSLFKVFILQAIFLWVISMSLQFGQLSPTPAKFTWLDILGIMIWSVGFLFESAGDWQLARFKADPANKGAVMDKGLWAYTRHPNYFGEVLIWWGLFLITLSTPHSWWTILSPLVISAVLLKMTGIPITEQALKKNRPGYVDYVERTNAFIPWRPKKEKT